MNLFDMFDNNESRDQDGFYVIIASEEDGVFIGALTKDGGRWRESTVEGNPPYNWGGNFMSYLTSQDIMQHMRNDYGRHYEVKGPFFDDQEAMQYAQRHFDFGADDYLNEFAPGVAEGDVIHHKFGMRQDQKGKTPYYKNPDIEVPMYDPVRGANYIEGLSKGEPQPYEHFKAMPNGNKIATIVGFTQDGKKIKISTAPIALATVLADAYNRGGFTDVPLQRVPLGENEQMDETLTFMGSPCTKDCSGHQAGYQWSLQRNGRTANGWSQSFNNGTNIAARVSKQRPQGGGKLPGYQSQTTNAVQKRNARAAAKATPQQPMAEDSLNEFEMPVGMATGTAATTDVPTPGNFSVVIVGRLLYDMKAIDVWKALEAIFPRDYPAKHYQDAAAHYGMSPQARVLNELDRAGQAIAKSGIASRDMAETFAAKFAKFKVPAVVEGEMNEDLPPPENSRKTQIPGTLPTYVKGKKHLDTHVPNGRTLDFGAGLGGGAAAMGADSYEPYPQHGFKPTYTQADSIPDNSYERVTNFNVLNVVPDYIRKIIVQHIGRVLAPGGVALITTRGKDVMSAKGADGPEPMSRITTIGTYQKGFSTKELMVYIQSVLGDGFEVSPLRLGPAGVIVRKLANQGVAEGNMPLTRAVDAKGRTQQQWMQAVKSKCPDAQIIQAKMMDGPCVANLSDGRRLNWIKVEQAVTEGYDSEELANEVYAEFERIYPNLARRAHERTIHAAIMDVLNYGGDNNPGALAQDVARAVKQQMQQGVAEGSREQVDPNTVWEVSFDYGPHQSDKVKVSASSQEEAEQKGMRAAKKLGHRFPQLNWAMPAEQGVAEGSLNEFAPGSSGGESGQWYTDDQLIELVGDGWVLDLDLSGSQWGMTDDQVPKEYLMREAQAWLTDQGFDVHVLNVKVNDDDCDWYIEGSFQNPRFAKEELTPPNKFLSKAQRLKAGDKVFYKGKLVGITTGKMDNDRVMFKPVANYGSKSNVASLPVDDISLREAVVDDPRFQKAMNKIVDTTPRAVVQYPSELIPPNASPDERERLSTPIRRPNEKVFQKMLDNFLDMRRDGVDTEEALDNIRDDLEQSDWTDDEIASILGDLNVNDIPDNDDMAEGQVIPFPKREVTPQNKKPAAKKNNVKAISKDRYAKTGPNTLQGPNLASIYETFNSKQEVINHFIKQGKSAAAGAAAWERGWRGTKQQKPTKAPQGPQQRYWWQDKDEVSEGRVYYNVIGTEDKKLRKDFGLSKDLRGWYLREDADVKKHQQAFKAFGTAKLKEYDLSAALGTTQTQGSDNIVSPVGSVPRGQIKR